MTTAVGIEELKAGRELDALVAEKVMGFQWGHFESAPAGWRGPNGALLAPWRWLCSPPLWDRFEPATGDETRYIDNNRRYSTDIAAAWEVVDRMIELGFEVDTLSFTPSAIDKNEWQAAFSSKPKKGDRHRMRQLFLEFDPSLPRAICIAALKAMEATA